MGLEVHSIDRNPMDFPWVKPIHGDLLFYHRLDHPSIFLCHFTNMIISVTPSSRKDWLGAIQLRPI